MSCPTHGTPRPDNGCRVCADALRRADEVRAELAQLAAGLPRLDDDEDDESGSGSDPILDLGESATDIIFETDDFRSVHLPAADRDADSTQALPTQHLPPSGTQHLPPPMPPERPLVRSTGFERPPPPPGGSGTGVFDMTRTVLDDRSHRRIIRCLACQALVRTRRMPGEQFQCPRCKGAFTLSDEQVLDETLRMKGGADRRPCPWCAELIKKAAVICKHCGRNVDELE